MTKLDSKQEGIFAIIAAFIVLFSAMWDPMVSIIVSVVAMLLYAIYKLKNGTQ